MRSTEYSLRHNELVRSQRAAQDISFGSLTAGDKKDLVLTNRLWTPSRSSGYLRLAYVGRQAHSIAEHGPWLAVCGL